MWKWAWIRFQRREGGIAEMLCLYHIDMDWPLCLSIATLVMVPLKQSSELSHILMQMPGNSVYIFFQHYRGNTEFSYIVEHFLLVCILFTMWLTAGYQNLGQGTLGSNRICVAILRVTVDRHAFCGGNSRDGSVAKHPDDSIRNGL